MAKLRDRLKFLCDITRDSMRKRAHPLEAIYLIIDYFIGFFHERLGLNKKLHEKWSHRGERNMYALAMQCNVEFDQNLKNIEWSQMREKIIEKSKDDSCYSFSGIKIPLLDSELWESFKEVFDEVIFPYICFDNHFCDVLHDKTHKVHYGLERRDFNVVIEPNDIVFDAGGWIGDFAAYASKCGATVYAFEPTPSIYGLLCKTAGLNPNINPINCGIGDKSGSLALYSSIDSEKGHDHDSSGNSFTAHDGRSKLCLVDVITLDDFVLEHHINKIDFIKADIEGFERHMLKGAKNILRRFAPKLAICTYHLHDDPEILESLIMEANPAYRIIHKPKILFAKVC
jgi:FkbM family methyltransferase